ncbi:YxiJ family protein [Paenibacillus eucommiae]|uniref:YxiJ-like protein n=1 Tax=Paenibacillus eucommiae TaxID=1355755 RepID=A0ABS4IM90_9BACL|nr:YxiJ family protein [Paenibacillus eucommiae]MBP1988686.1 hypothetical protein [Paenibacillus eucommiae]
MNKEEILANISYLYNFQLVNPFPYEDTEKIKRKFASLEVESLNADFNDYCAVIAGTTSYILKGKVTEIPNKQVELLNEDFFQRFPNYSLIETSLKKYPDFQAEYNNFEQLRHLIQKYLFDIKT